jgi:hypothetical protein
MMTPEPKPLTKLQTEVEAGETVQHIEQPRYPGFFCMSFLVKKFLGFYWLQIILEHPAALNHTSSIAGFPSWEILLEHLTDRRANDMEWELVGGDPLQLPPNLTDFLYGDQEKKRKWNIHLECCRQELADFSRAIEGEPGDQAPADQGEA